MTTPPVATAATDQHTAHIDALLADVSRAGDVPELKYLNWVARRFGKAVADELDRQRRAQYGFCDAGHHRSVRVVPGTAGRFVRHQVFCPTCEAAH